MALTRPLTVDGEPLPGWWVSHDPHRRQSPAFNGGHGNFGATHGITGPLALLSLAARRGVVVGGQLDAIALGDRRRKTAYEQVLLACLDDPVQQARSPHRP